MSLLDFSTLRLWKHIKGILAVFPKTNVQGNMSIDDGQGIFEVNTPLASPG